MRIGSEVEMIASSAESMLSIFRVGACADAGFTKIAAAPVTAANSSICRRENLPAFMIVPPVKISTVLYALSYPSASTVSWPACAGDVEFLVCLCELQRTGHRSPEASCSLRIPFKHGCVELYWRLAVHSLMNSGRWLLADALSVSGIELNG